MRFSGFSILAICTPKIAHHVSVPIEENKQVYWIYVTLQRWMNDVYSKRFGHYPRLYLFGLREGSRISSLLCRVLPVQAQILYVFPGDPVLLLHSDHQRDTQNRLIADRTFANWFYFDYCSKENLPPNNRCPFRHRNKQYFNPVPPTHFVYVEKDALVSLKNYTKMLFDIQTDSFRLGGALLAQKNALKISVASALEVTPDAMRGNFNQWSCKPWHSELFYEHFTNPTFDTKYNGTCWCAKTDFLYFTRYPNVTELWSNTKREKYDDYVKDIKCYKFNLCKTLCGDILGGHSIISHHVENTLRWLDEMDEQRSQYRIEEYLSRPLRLWMYSKEELVRNKTCLIHNTPMNSSCGRHLLLAQMYSSEYFLQDYFRQLNQSYPFSRHNLVWAKDPLSADYYIIPHDFICIIWTEYIPSMIDVQLTSLRVRANEDYLIPLLNNVRGLFPYWSMSAGSNHIMAFTSGGNKGLIPDSLTRDAIRNVICLGYSGFRRDLLPQLSSPLYVQKGIVPHYRHNYDIVIPAFNRLQWVNNKPVTTSSHRNKWYEQKKSLFFFAGTVNNSNTFQSVRRHLSILMKDIGEGKKYGNATTIGEKDFQTMRVVNGYVSSTDYLQMIRSSIFSLCPEGFSPWSPRLFESVTLGSIPLILAQSIVLPFERFVDWRSFSMKISIDKVENIIDLARNIARFEDHVKEKLQNATRYFHAFRWPYSPSDQNHDRHSFLPEEDLNGTAKNVFYYLSLELRCRRLEQLYGLELDSFSIKSVNAKRQACNKHPTICPCSEEKTSIAIEEYI